MWNSACIRSSKPHQVTTRPANYLMLTSFCPLKSDAKTITSLALLLHQRFFQVDSSASCITNLSAFPPVQR